MKREDKNIHNGTNATVWLFVVGVTFIMFLMASCTDDMVTDNSPPPLIVAITPDTGPAGTPVTITGTDFGATISVNTVMFNGKTAAINSANTTTISVTVPAGATTGNVTVTVKGKTATSEGEFVVTP